MSGKKKKDWCQFFSSLVIGQGRGVEMLSEERRLKCSGIIRPSKYNWAEKEKDNNILKRVSFTQIEIDINTWVAEPGLKCNGEYDLYFPKISEVSRQRSVNLQKDENLKTKI